MYKHRTMLKKIVIGGLIATIAALICRLGLNGIFEVNYVNDVTQCYAYMTLALSMIIGIMFMNPAFALPIRLMGSAFFGAGFGGLIINLNNYYWSVICNAPQWLILLCEILAFSCCFALSGVLYSRKVKTDNTF